MTASSAAGEPPAGEPTASEAAAGEASAEELAAVLAALRLRGAAPPLAAAQAAPAALTEWRRRRQAALRATPTRP